MKRLITFLILVSVLPVLSGCRNGRPPNTVFSADDAEGRVIGVLEGSSSLRFAEELGSAYVSALPEELAAVLKSGVVDCAVLEKPSASALVSKTSGIKLLTAPLCELELSFAVAKENTKLTRAVNSALAALAENGVLAGLYEEYIAGGSYDYSPPESAGTASRLLSLAVSFDFPPYSYLDENGEPDGFDVAVARAVCDVLGVGLQIAETDGAELISAVRFGKADFALGCLYANERDLELVDFTDTYAQHVQMIVVRK